MLLDKMAISHSNHLFVPVVFVFCLLSPLIQAEDSDDYTDSRQLGKNLVVSRQRNNIQWLPNYNWKPPEHYGLRYFGKPHEESTGEKAGVEFTKPEDPEQRIADPWIKKMQEISRQKREKWVPYKRNENEKLTLDDVEETTRTNKLTNDESITPLDSIPMTLAQSSMDQDSASVKNLHDSPLLQSTGKNTNKLNKKLDLWDISVENPSAEIIEKAPVVKSTMQLHQRYKDYEISDIKEDLLDKQNATVADYEKNELEKDRSLTSKVNSQESKESNSQKSKSQHSRDNTHRNSKKHSKSDENLNSKINSKESLAKVNSRRSNLSQNNKEENSKNNNGHKKIVTTKPLTSKSKEEKDTTGRPLNREGSFHSGRWGMSVSQPPTEFQKDISRSTHRKNKEHNEGEKDGRHDSVGRWSNVASPPNKPHKDQNIMLHLTAHLGVKSSQVKESSHRQSLAHQNHQNSQASIIERNKGPADTLHEQIPKNFYHSRYPKVSYRNNYRTNVDLNNRLLRNLKFLIQDLQSYVEQNDVPVSCLIQIPYVLFRI